MELPHAAAPAEEQIGTIGGGGVGGLFLVNLEQAVHAQAAHTHAGVKKREDTNKGVNRASH